MDYRLESIVNIVKGFRETYERGDLPSRDYLESLVTTLLAAARQEAPPPECPAAIRSAFGGRIEKDWVQQVVERIGDVPQPAVRAILAEKRLAETRAALREMADALRELAGAPPSADDRLLEIRKYVKEALRAGMMDRSVALVLQRIYGLIGEDP